MLATTTTVTRPHRRVPAGCGGFGFSDGDDPVTPAPVPTSRRPPTRPASAHVVTSPSVLGSAHGDRPTEAGTGDENRTVRLQRVTVPPSRPRRAGATGHTRNNPTAPRGPGAPGRPPATASFWSDGDRYLRRLARDNQTIYNEYDPPDSYAGTWRYCGSYRRAERPSCRRRPDVAPFHTRTRQSQQPDGTVYVIRGDRLRETRHRQRGRAGRTRHLSPTSLSQGSSATTGPSTRRSRTAATRSRHQNCSVSGLGTRRRAATVARQAQSTPG